MDNKKEHWLFDREYIMGLKVALGGIVWFCLAFYLSEVKGVFSNIEEALIPCGLITGGVAQIIVWIRGAFKRLIQAIKSH